MKNSNPNKRIGFLIGLFCFALMINTAFTASSPDKQKTKTEKGIHVTSITQNVTAIAVKGNFMLTAFDMPVVVTCKPVETICYPVAVNDVKPDNTNYQLIRAKHLKLHVAIEAAV